ncbi:threonine ammonia-lyase IlvA [Amylibacter sp. SFDW26]|uniref:threonine ammonia-lyase IlvA n=1 Tax=Amylibacter sp. SFDW26 TaxID=2652722 RepID=UPI0012616B91|nr:threonine ammonia-lyase IlvA [Amylibacter sp. SFDW26]KAB7614677.1 threonine ammonia-lyase IlvA [Amylibacter sp. SFDW26]
MADFLNDVAHATKAMRALFPATPLQKNEYLSDKFSAEIYLKREDLSPVRSYKIRGAFNAMSKALASGDKPKVFVCASAGNHAQGIAFACKHFGVKGVVFMPVTTPGQKINKTAAFGGKFIEIRLEGDYFDETLVAAQKYAKSADGVFLPPYDSVDVIEGQASVVHEIREQLSKPIDYMIFPVGGGGLSSGSLKYYGACDTQPEIRLVEPMGGRSLHAALENGGLVTLPTVDNFVDGAAVARIGDNNFEVLKQTSADHVLGVDENRLCATILELLNVEGIVLEPAGALTVDALKDMTDEIAGKRIVCVTSGGNFDFERLPDVKERALRFEGLKKYLILRLPQRPGALKDFLNLLGPEDDIARFEYLKKSARNFGSVLIGIETSAKGGFESLFDRIDKAGFTFRDITDDETLAEFLV